jgi:Uma2 family endonuclease
MTLMAQQLPECPQPHRFTRAEYYQMADLGFFEGHRVELIEGEIVEMAAMKDLHAVMMGIVAHTLEQAFRGCWVRSQLPLSFIKDNEPEPDFAVVAGSPRDHLGKGHPKTAMLVIEVADTTLRFDRGTKAALYARANIAEYWIVNLVDMCVEVHREPKVDAIFGCRYMSITKLCPPATIMPLAKPDAPIAVADLLP